MILTLTNNTTKTFNKLAIFEGDGVATGGAKENPLPYPFDWVPPLAPAGSVAFSVHEQDFRNKRVYGMTHDPRDEWNTLLRANSISGADLAYTIGAEATATDIEDLFLTAL